MTTTVLTLRTRAHTLHECSRYYFRVPDYVYTWRPWIYFCTFAHNAADPCSSVRTLFLRTSSGRITFVKTYILSCTRSAFTVDARTRQRTKTPNSKRTEFEIGVSRDIGTENENFFRCFTGIAYDWPVAVKRPRRPSPAPYLFAETFALRAAIAENPIRADLTPFTRWRIFPNGWNRT